MSKLSPISPIFQIEPLDGERAAALMDLLT